MEYYKQLLNLKEENNLEDFDAAGKILLKWIWQEMGRELAY
jgi:hypothetical protein